MVVPVRVLWVAALTLACGETDVTASSADATTAATATASGRQTSSAQTAATSSSAAPARPKSTLQGTWTATFKSELAKVTLEPGVSDKAWASDKGDAAVGEGTIELTIAESGLVKGTLKGALGELLIAGMAEGDVVNGTFTAERPEPATFSGTIELANKAGVLEGELRASSGDAKLVRRGTLSLKKK